MAQVRSERILIVEDNAVNQAVAQGILESLGYAHETASDGGEALRLLDRYSFDLVLMDCQMPVLNGYQATRALRDREEREHRVRVPVVALTAHATSEDRRKCMDAGMDDYISKPVVAEALEAVLGKFLSGLGTQTRLPVEVPDAEPMAIRFDRDDLLRRLQGNKGLFHRVGTIFVRTLPEQMAQLASEISMTGGDPGPILHGIKGACLNAGARRAGLLASGIEDDWNAGRTEEARARIPVLMDEAKALEAEVRAAMEG
jgi:CheY-like chemotaxis protein